MNFNAKLKELKLFIGIVILRKIFNLIILIGLILIFIIFLYKDLKLLNIVCNYADTVAYIDSDSVATHNVDKIFL
jgi:hypothetical protein